jgi:hypothetical protein
MKTFNLFVVILTLTMIASCGDKDKKKSDNGLPVYNLLTNPGQIPVPTTQSGTMNMQSGVITVGSQSYMPNQISQQGAQFANTIFTQLQQSPFLVNPISTNPNVYRIQITGYAIQGGGYQMQGGYQQFPQQQQVSGIQLVITAPIQPLNR